MFVSKLHMFLLKNMSELPFVSSFYPFLVEHDGIITYHFGQKVKFKFVSKFDVDTDDY